MSKSILITISTPPYESANSPECIDTLLSCAAFEQKADLLLLGYGIFHLQTEQQANLIPSKQYTEVFKGLDWFDLAPPFVCEDSLNRFQLDAEQLICPVQTVNRAALAALYANYSYIIQG